MQESEPPGWPLCEFLTISIMLRRHDLETAFKKVSCSLVRFSLKFGGVTGGRFVGIMEFFITGRKEFIRQSRAGIIAWEGRYLYRFLANVDIFALSAVISL